MSTDTEQDKVTESTKFTDRTVRPYAQALISRYLGGKLPEIDRTAVFDIIGCNHACGDDGAASCDCAQKAEALWLLVSQIRPGIECLQFLLRLVLVDRKTGTYDSIDRLYLRPSKQSRKLLAEHGFRLLDDAEGSLIIANQSTRLRSNLLGTRWFRRGWRQDLALLPGVRLRKPTNFRGYVSRAVVIPGALLPKL